LTLTAGEVDLVAFSVEADEVPAAKLHVRGSCVHPSRDRGAPVCTLASGAPARTPAKVAKLLCIGVLAVVLQPYVFLFHEDDDANRYPHNGWQVGNLQQKPNTAAAKSRVVVTFELVLAKATHRY
jgi:hypothetical protein